MADSQKQSKAKHIEEIREGFQSIDRAVMALVRENQRTAASQSWCFNLLRMKPVCIKTEINRFSHNCAMWTSVRDCHATKICLIHLYLLLLCKAALLYYCFDLDISATRFLCFHTGNSTENEYNKCVAENKFSAL